MLIYTSTVFSGPGSFFSPSPAKPDGMPVPLRYLIVPCLVFILFSLAGSLIFNIDQIKVRPWLFFPIFGGINFCFISLTLYYGVTACSKFGFFPLFILRGAKELIFEFFKSLGLLFVINFCIIIPVATLVYFMKTRIRTHTLIDLANNMPGSWGIICLLILGFTLIPVVEEIFFRGFIYNALKTKFSAVSACILQALLFAVCHPYGLIGNVYIFLLGIALAVVYETKNDLIRPVFIHCLKNGLVLIPFIIVTAGNMSPAANSYQSALTPPLWLTAPSTEKIERKPDGKAQLDHAMAAWEEKPFKNWKQQAREFAAVTKWFPDDRESSSRAQLKLALIYHRQLGDQWRAIATAQQLREDYPEQHEQCAMAMAHEGWAYYMLKKFPESHTLFTQVLKTYPQVDKAANSARKGLKWIATISPDTGAPEMKKEKN